MSFSVLEKCKKARQNYIDEKKNNKKQWEVFARIVSCHFLRVWLRLFRHAREYPQLLEWLGLSRFARDIFLDVACMFWHFFSGNPLGGKRKHQVTLRFTSRPTCWISDGFLSAKLFLEWSDMSDQLIISSHWPKLQVKVHQVFPILWLIQIPKTSQCFRARGLTEIHQKSSIQRLTQEHSWTINPDGTRSRQYASTKCLATFETSVEEVESWEDS